MTTSNYPESYDTFDKPGSIDKVNIGQSHSNSHKHLANALEAVQATLGTNPHAGFSTVTERLAYLTGLISYDPSGLSTADLATLLAGLSSGERAGLSDAILSDITSELTSQYAPLASPTFTGNVVVPDADADNEALNRITADGRYTPRRSLVFPGAITDHVWSLNKEGWRPSSSLDVRAVISPADWTPDDLQTIVALYDANGTRSWYVGISNFGATARHRMTLSQDGTTALGHNASAAIPGLTDGQELAMRWVWQASGPSIDFYYAPASHDLGDTGWTKLGSTITSNVYASLFGSAAFLRIGTAGASNPYAGGVRKVKIIVDGVLQGSPDFTTPFRGSTRDEQGNVWTLAGTGSKWVDGTGTTISRPFDPIDTALVWINQFEAIGTGSPEGVVTAPVGTKYRDRAATNGAVEWIKASGSGNTGWLVVFGDTGWRVLASWTEGVQDNDDQLGTISSSITLEGDGQIRVRRVNNQVKVWMGDMTGITSNGNRMIFSSALTGVFTAAIWPSGFRIDVVAGGVPMHTSSSGTFIRFGRQLSSLDVRIGVSTPPAVVYCGNAEWTTSSAWPTSLPGVAA